MHPNPSADTSKPLVPSFRFSIVVLLISRWRRLLSRTHPTHPCDAGAFPILLIFCLILP